ncbi:MAG: hypothetical protein AB1428_06235 [Bacteroidota bacterium]
MGKTVHKVYVIFLIALGLLSVVVITVHGASYYTTSLTERPFHPEYDSLKPTGLYGHGYGIVGTLMIMFGVVMYSSRKRVRALANLGRIKYFLEFHIFLCLLGPILVVYHTTFKIGGLVAVSFWSMTAVVLSGLAGRYFYIQLPKGIQGNELSITDLQKENEKLAESLSRRFRLSADFIKWIDAIASPPKEPAKMSLFEVINFFVINDITRRGKLRTIFSRLEQRGLHVHVVRQFRTLATRRAILTRRIAFLEQFRQIFHYWHVVHLPFSIVMFIILFIHVGVAVAFGYTWVW